MYKTTTNALLGSRIDAESCPFGLALHEQVSNSHDPSATAITTLSFCYHFLANAYKY